MFASMLKHKVRVTVDIKYRSTKCTTVCTIIVIISKLPTRVYMHTVLIGFFSGTMHACVQCTERALHVRTRTCVLCVLLPI